nr:hypothetical protein Iba_chr11aCG19700 [Ipomoea batatas]
MTPTPKPFFGKSVLHPSLLDLPEACIFSTTFCFSESIYLFTPGNNLFLKVETSSNQALRPCSWITAKRD